MTPLRDDLRELGERLWPDDSRLRPRMPARASRRRTLLVSVLSAALIVAVVAGGTFALRSRDGASSPTAPSSSSQIVPWLAAPANVETAPMTVPGIPPCTTSYLTISIHVAYPSEVGAGPLNTSSWAVQAVNHGSRACYVGAPLDVKFVTARGTLTLPRTTYLQDIQILEPFRPQESQFLSKVLLTGEIDTGPCRLPPVTSMLVSLGPGLGTTRVVPGPAGGWGTPCIASDESYISEWFPLQSLASQLPVPATLPVSSMQAFITPSGAAHPDSYVTFTVRLLDAPNGAFSCAPIAGRCGPTPYPSVSWSPCPAYHEEIEGVDRSLQAYRLNCQAATPLTPQQTETFQMKLWVPPGTRSGVYVMRWSLDDPVLGSPFARALVTITP